MSPNEDEVVTHFTLASHYPNNGHLSPLFSNGNNHVESFDIEAASLSHEAIDEPIDSYASHKRGEFDFEVVDNMRIRGNLLFYKLERSSREFEEYNLEFHRRKAPKGKYDKGNIKEEKKAKPNPKLATKAVKAPKVHQVMSTKDVGFDEINDTSLGNKRPRTPTFNQLTGHYHEPFCLNIYISKASVRACIVHRVCSKAVVVAHSIYKDMKFDLASTKDKAACAAVGAILPQRAVDDDIHDVILHIKNRVYFQGLPNHRYLVVLQNLAIGPCDFQVMLGT